MEITRELELTQFCYTNFILMAELKNNSFNESEYFKQMQFQNMNAKNIIEKFNIDNQGYMLIALYTLFVVPKSLYDDRNQSNEYQKLNQWFEKNVIKDKTVTNYTKDYNGKRINYVRHIRNAIAHARISFVPLEYVTFYDEYESERFETSIKLSKIEELLVELQKIIIKFMDQNLN